MANLNSKKKSIKSLAQNLQAVKAAFEDTSSEVKAEAKEMLNDILQDLSDVSSGYKDSVIEYINEKPLKSLGIALLSGIIIGKLIL